MLLGRDLKTFVAHSLTIALIAFSGAAYGASKEKVLHAFAGGKTGATEFSSLIFDSAGNLYGTAQRGGDMSVCDDAGCGVVFKLTPNAGGKWKETVLYTFSGGKDGAFPSAALTLDSSGNLYGTTANGGSMSGQLCQESGCGVVFELSPVGGRWKLIVLHRFHGKDGSQPFAPVTFDTAGNLYGTTASGGGTGGNGVVYKLTPGSNGEWKETVLHAFAGGNDGASPLTGVVLDES